MYIGPLEPIRICSDLNSIMLNVAHRIKVVQADVSGIQNVGHKRQQCFLYRKSFLKSQPG